MVGFLEGRVIEGTRLSGPKPTRGLVTKAGSRENVLDASRMTNAMQDPHDIVTTVSYARGRVWQEMAAIRKTKRISGKTPRPRHRANSAGFRAPIIIAQIVCTWALGARRPVLADALQHLRGRRRRGER